MTHDRCLWALGGSRFTAFILAVTLIAVALFYFATPRSRINSVAVLPFVNGSSDVPGASGVILKSSQPAGRPILGPVASRSAKLRDHTIDRLPEGRRAPASLAVVRRKNSEAILLKGSWLVDVAGLEPVAPCLQSSRLSSDNSMLYF
jgi:hypothetical protein